MSNTVPEGWEVKTVGDIGSVVTGSTPSTTEPLFWGGATPFISPADFDGKIYIDKTSRTLSEEGTKKARELPKDAILVTCIGSLGGMALTSKPSVTNQQINAVVAEENQESRFHFYNILFNMHELIKSAGTTTLPIINKSTFSQINLLFPPLPEQQKIATILSSVDNVIEKTRAQIDKLKDLKTGMMQELLTKGIGHTAFKDSPVGRIPACWELVRLDKVTKVIDSLHQTPKFSSEGLPMIRIGDIRPGKVNVEKALKVSRDVFEQFTKNHKPKKGDLLMSRVGSYGVCCYLDSNIDLCLGQNTVVILPDKVNSLFLYYSIYSQAIQKQIEFEVAGSGYKSLSLASIRALKVTLPPANEQVKLVSILDSIDKNIDARNESLTAYKSAKKALMQDLLTGKVRVNLTDKESAAV